jgi:hypothetical protein
MNDDLYDRPATDPADGTEPPDPAFRRLQEADPAAGLAADLDRIKAEVDARTVPPARTGWRWSQIAAAVIAVALVGAGGYTIGHASGSRQTTAAESSSGGSQPTGTTNSAAVDEAAPGVAQQEPAAAPGLAPTVLNGTTVAGGGSSGYSSDKSLAYSTFRTVFSDGGVSADGGTASGWAFDASQTVSAATAERLAAAFGISGTAVASWGSWNVGPTDGSGPTITLSSDGTASFYYYDPSVQFGGCAPVTYTAGAGAAESAVADDSAVCALPTTMSTTAIDDETATQRVKDLITAVGLDPATFEFDVQADASPESGYLSVAAYPLVGGARIDLAWWFSFVGDQLSGANGQLAPVVAAGDYTVISPAQAVARLNDPRFGANGPIYPAGGPIPVDPGIGTTQSSDTVTTPPAPVTDGTVSWPVNQVSITGATLGLGTQYQPDGTVLLLPTYTLSDGSGATWSVIAITDDRLDFSTG